MRLLFIDRDDCYHITEIMNSVKAVYQMEQEFHPYLIVDFLPKHSVKGRINIILEAGSETVKKYYNLETEDGVNKLRQLLWTYLHKYHNIRNYNSTHVYAPTNNVIQSWYIKKKQLAKYKCCGADDVYKPVNIKHSVYKNTPPLTCRTARLKECRDNFPISSAMYRRCENEVNTMCGKTYVEHFTGDIHTNLHLLLIVAILIILYTQYGS